MKRIFYLLILLLPPACVPNQKVVLLQNNDLHEDIPKDTVMQTYIKPSLEYKLSEGDVVLIKISSLTDEQFDFFSSGSTEDRTVGANPSLMGQIINENGHVKYPVLGKVKLGGLGITEAEDYLQQIAAGYVSDPVVKIRLLNYRVTFLGEINAPGVHTTMNDRMSFTEAIGYAGGFTELADIENIKLIRKLGDKQEVVYINPLQEDFITSPFYYLHPNDIIVVPPLRQRPFRRYFGQNLGIFVSSLSLLLLIINYLNVG